MKQLVKLWKRPSYDGQSYSYYLLYTDENGKRRQKALGHADTKRAERERSQFERELKTNPGETESKRMRLSELLKDYLERTRTQIESSTAWSAEYRMNDLTAAIGNIYADQVTYRHCERFQQYCIDRGLSPASVNTHIKMVKRIFSLAVKRGQLEKNPFIGLPLLKVPKGTIRLFSQDEFDQLLLYASSPIWKAKVLLAKTSGLRRGEILNLTLKDVDFINGKLTVQPKAETEFTWRWVVKDKDRREVPLIDEVAQLLANIHAELPEGQPYLLLTPQRYQHLMMLKKQGTLTDRYRKCPDANFRRGWGLICKKAAVEDADFHDLRRTCITEWMENGMHPHEVQRLAGHADLNTTMEYYVGIRKSVISRAKQASKKSLSEKFVANLLQVPKKGKSGQDLSGKLRSQTPEDKEVKEIGATGLEPATS